MSCSLRSVTHIHGYAIHIAILEFIYMYALTNTSPSIAPS